MLAGCYNPTINSGGACDGVCSTTPPLAPSNTLTVGVEHTDFRFEYFLVIGTMP